MSLESNAFEGEMNAEKRNNVFEKPYAPLGMAKITKTDSTKCWQGCRIIFKCC